MLQGVPHAFLINKSFRTKGVSVLISEKVLYYLALHLKLATPANFSQLVEVFAYENPIVPSHHTLRPRPSSPLLVYQFHNLFSQERLFVFAASLKFSGLSAPKSLGELFATSTWLEREVGEMHGVCFGGKRDLRNLMLQYGDASAPFRKSYPPIGLKEIFFDSVTDTLIQVPVSTQI